MAGPTGKYPDGKGNSEDRGSLETEISVQDGYVVINFDTLLSWIALSPADAKAFAKLIIKNANKACN